MHVVVIGLREIDLYEQMVNNVSVMQEHQQMEHSSQHGDVTASYEQHFPYKGYSSVVT